MKLVPSQRVAYNFNKPPPLTRLKIIMDFPVGGNTGGAAAFCIRWLTPAKAQQVESKTSTPAIGNALKRRRQAGKATVAGTNSLKILVIVLVRKNHVICSDDTHVTVNRHP